MKSAFKLFLTLSLVQVFLTSYPIAVFHGLGDICLNPGMSDFTKKLGKETDSISHCFESGGSLLDFSTSFVSQAQKACDHLKNHEDFKGKDISVVGLSQGALIARYIIEECNFGGSVKRFISIGGPQMGVAAFPHCESGIGCNILNKITGSVVYYSAIQNHVGPAGYFKVYNDEESFIKGSTFLAELNNERITPNSESYKNKIMSLEKMVLIKFEKDTMIIPRETAWFQFYNEKKELLEFKDTEVYKKDLIGLKGLNEAGKIVMDSINGDHLQFTEKDIEEKMIPYLKN
jgi:palmitoyl-protein thioesterase